MADENDVPSGLDLPFGLTMDLGHQRAGRIDIIEPAFGGLVRNRLGHAMRGKDHRHAVRHVVHGFHEDRAFVFQRIDDIFVVHDFMPDIDRCPIDFERALDDGDSAVHAGAEAARRRDKHLKRAAVRG